MIPKLVADDDPGIDDGPDWGVTALEEGVVVVMSFACEAEEYKVAPVVVGVVRLELSPVGADIFLDAEGEVDKIVVDDVVVVVTVVIVAERELPLPLPPSPAKLDPEPDRPALTEAVEESCRTNVEITTTDLTKSLTPIPNRRRRILASSKLVPAP